MIEMEVKVEVKDFTSIRRLLKDVEAKKIGRIYEVDTYYDHPVRNFTQTNETLRIRRSSTGRQTITYKAPAFSQMTKARVEYTVDINDGDKMDEILQTLNFRPVEMIEKSREIWALKKILVNLDDVKSLGKFVELETILKNRCHNADSEKRLFFALRQLGLDDKPLIKKSYLQLVREKRLR